MKEAAKRGKNLQFGLKERAIINENVFDNIYLPELEPGKVDVSRILFLGAENNFDEAKKFVIYQNMLEQLSNK